MDFFSSQNEFEKQLVATATVKRQPLGGAFELLPLCNLSCGMCYLHRSAELCRESKDLLPLSFWLGIARELQSAGTLFLLLTGGEPFLYPEFEELYLQLREMGFILSINTNGTLITPERAQFLAMHRPRRVNVTLYGTCPETYGRVTGNAPAFEWTMAGIRHLLEAGIDVKMNVSLVPDNVDELEAFYRIAESFGVPLEVNAYMYPATREAGEVYESRRRLDPLRAAAASLQDDRLRFPEPLWEERLGAMAGLYEEEQARDNAADPTIGDADDPNADPTADDAVGTASPDSADARGEILPCRAATSSFWVDWRGNLAPCVFLSGQTIDLKEDGISFSEGWNTLTQIREDLRLPEKCGHCRMRPFCLVCGAAVFHETKGMGQVPEYLCQMTREKLRLAYLDKKEKQSK